ncbi:hypothetical protein Tcan_06347 [Toxocara canis]|uniref:SH2 domain-containing protein n=1 Tax=Toxocara canis TaxID=6265 RepID=A0A0B2V9T0_TOXCA|nr:hypothetical protein Tcan_06347 [Toxocara canis]
MYDSWREPEPAKGSGLQCCVHGHPCPFARPAESEISDRETGGERNKAAAAAAAAEGYEEVSPPQGRISRSMKQSSKKVSTSSKKKHRPRRTSKHKQQSRQAGGRVKKSSPANEKNGSEKGHPFTRHRVERHPILRSSDSECLHASANLYRSSRKSATKGGSQTTQRDKYDYEDEKNTPRYELGHPFTRHRVERHPILRSSDSECLHASANLYRSSRKSATKGGSQTTQRDKYDYEDEKNTPRYELVPTSKKKEAQSSKKWSGGFSSGISPVPLRSSGSGVETARHAASEASSLSSVYIGVLTPREAENCATEPTSFRLYHKLPTIRSLREIPPKLPLTVVYCNDNGMHYHYAIKERKRFVQNAGSSGQLLPVVSFQVDYGDSQAPIFTSIRSLVNYYTVYSQLRGTEDGGNVVDIFPRWRRKKYVPDDE